MVPAEGKQRSPDLETIFVTLHKSPGEKHRHECLHWGHEEHRWGDPSLGRDPNPTRQGGEESPGLMKKT